MGSETMAPSRRRLAVGAGVEIAFVDCGARAGAASGPPIVILHGLAGSSREFEPTADALPERRTVLVDLRAHGRSTTRPNDVSREAFVADVAALIRHLDAGPVVLVGQSLGAKVALLVAAEHPSLVERLVLLECGAGAGTADGAAGVADFFASWPEAFADRAAATAFLGAGPLAESWISDLVADADGCLRPRFDPRVLADLARPVEADTWSEWAAVTAPTLVLFAENGLFSAEEKDEFVERGPAPRRVDLAGASHDAHLDAHEAWITALRGFLRGGKP